MIVSPTACKLLYTLSPKVEVCKVSLHWLYNIIWWKKIVHPKCFSCSQTNYTEWTKFLCHFPAEFTSKRLVSLEIKAKIALPFQSSLTVLVMQWQLNNLPKKCNAVLLYLYFVVALHCSYTELAGSITTYSNKQAISEFPWASVSRRGYL